MLQLCFLMAMTFVSLTQITGYVIGGGSFRVRCCCPHDVRSSRRRRQQQRQYERWIPPHSQQKRQQQVNRFFATSRRDEEIEKLEMQLRQLREGSIPSLLDSSTEQRDDDDASPSSRIVVNKRTLEKVQGKDMILSESELQAIMLSEEEQQDKRIKDVDVTNSSSGLSIPAIVSVIAAFVFLFFFAQVPVGQDQLSKYSASGSSTVKTIDLGDLNPDKPKLIPYN